VADCGEVGAEPPDGVRVAAPAEDIEARLDVVAFDDGLPSSTPSAPDAEPSGSASTSRT
jgi:hypothetical protein